MVLDLFVMVIIGAGTLMNLIGEIEACMYNMIHIKILSQLWTINLHFICQLILHFFELRYVWRTIEVIVVVNNDVTHIIDAADIVFDDLVVIKIADLRSYRHFDPKDSVTPLELVCWVVLSRIIVVIVHPVKILSILNLYLQNIEMFKRLNTRWCNPSRRQITLN